jgi:outer membrane usher protein
VHNDTTAALVVFVRPDGSFVPVGSRGRLDGGGDFVVGYDGQSFVRQLADSNRVTIDLGDSICHASFGFQPEPGQQVRIGPVPCR